MKAQTTLVVSVLFCCVLLPVFGRGSREQPPVVVDNVLQHSFPAPDFTLTDQHGLPFHMADTKGKVVLMTFIYTHCTDICPFVSLKVKKAHDLLGADADKVVLIAVTTDPKRDVPKVTAAYSKELGLLDAWHFLGGAAPAVQAVWASYGIGVTVDPDTAAAAPPADDKMGASSSKGDEMQTSSGPEPEGPTKGLSQPDILLAGRIANDFGGGYEVGHSAPFWIVDKQGQIRVGMDASASPADIATNMRALLKLK